MKKLALIFLAIFGAFAVQAQEPLNWVGDTDIEVFQESSNVYAGNYSCGIIVNTGTQANCDFDNDVAIPVNAGDTFTMSFWGYTSEFVRARAKLTWSDGAVLYATTYLGPNTGGWAQFTFEGEVPADITSAKVGVRFYDVAGFTPGEVQYIDGFAFESPTGNPLMVTNGDFEQWSGLAPEPTNYPTDFAAEAVGLGATLSWTDAVGAQLPAGYLIKASNEDNITLPEDGVYVSDDLDLSDGAGAANVAFGEEGFTFPNLEASQTYYFKIFPYSNSGANVDYKTDGTPPSAEVQTAETVVIQSQNFDASFGEWQVVSVLGDEVWTRDNNYGVNGTPCAQMTGYVSGTIFPNDDWIISPSMNFNDFESEVLTFYSAVGYITSEEQFAVRISTDYDGGGDPTTATWTDLDPVLPDGGTNWVWTYSENVDLSGFNGDNVYVAFVYFCGDVDAATWEVDEIVITGEGQFTPDPEPTNYPADFAANVQGQSISLTWTDAVGEQLPAGYLVLGSDDGSFDIPVDGTPLADDPDLSDGSAMLNIALGVEACAFNNLPAPETFYFAIFPYTNSGEFIDYKTDGTYPTADAETVPVSFLLFTDFNDDWGGWTPISIIGDQVWSRDNTYGLESTPCALMSGYAGGNFENEDWLISPELDFTSSTNKVMRSYSARNYTGPDLLLKVSTNYDGGGDPSTATWTDITDMVNWSSGSFTWTESGAVSLTQFSGNMVHIAYQFFSTETASSNWEIDNVEVTQEELLGEPTNYPMSFAATAVDQTITLTWVDAIGEILPEAYLLKANIQNVIVAPVDGVPIPNDPDLSDGTAYVNVEYGVETFSFSGLEESTTYYFKIYPFTNSGNLIDYKTDGTAPASSATTEEDLFETLLFTTFDDSWEAWEQISVVGDQVWDRDNTYGIENTPCARMSGYSGGSFANEDWLISPQVDVSGSWGLEQLIFHSAKAYTGLPLEVKISTDYDGDPGAATWTDLSDEAIWPEDGSFFVWTNSGILDISNWGNDKINIAFVYQSTDAESASWEVDNVYVKAMVIESVKELNENTVSIYPNPGNGVFNIEAANTIKTIEVYSLTGALVARQNPEALSTRMDLSELNQGIYFARITDGEGNIITNKIVIE